MSTRTATTPLRAHLWEGTATKLGMSSLLLFTGASIPAVAAGAAHVVRGSAYRSDLLDAINVTIRQVEDLQTKYGSAFDALDLSYSEAPGLFAYEDTLQWDRVAIELKAAPRTYEAFSEKPDIWR